MKEDNAGLSFWHPDQAKEHVLAWRREVERRKRTIDGFVDGLRRAQPGDFVTKCYYSDRGAYEVVAVSPSGQTLTLHPLKATLLNGFDSGEKDALVSYPGGFAHHVEGHQRYRYERIEPKDPKRFSTVRWSKKRKRYQGRGGNPSVIAGAHQHYDYNF
jgi:hypothetical protein